MSTIFGNIYNFRMFKSFKKLYNPKSRLTIQVMKWLSSDQKQDILKRRQEIMSKGLPKQKPIVGVKHIVLVCSGKGGVGKSTTSVNLASALKCNNPEIGIGLLDTDVFGPTVPLMMNLSETPNLTKENLMEPLINYGVKCMSMGFLVDKDTPVIWRGLMVMQAIEKLLRQVHWGDVEFLIVDTPPGTGDTLLSLVQNLPVSGVILVTTPQTAALQVTKRGAMMFKKLNVPVIGIVENMNCVKCTSCSQNINIFGTGTTKLAKDLGCNILGSLPLDPAMENCSDNGTPIVIQDKNNESSVCYRSIASDIVRFLGKSQHS